MKNLQKALMECPLFQGLGQPYIEKLASISRMIEIPRRGMIFQEGDTARGFYIILGGQVKIYKSSPDGKEQILHIFEAGEPIGEVPVFAGKPYPASALALRKTLLSYMPKEDFQNLVKQNPDLAMNMLAVLSLRLRRFTIQVEHLSLMEIPGRLAAHLLYLDAEHEMKGCVTLSISKGELASLLGTIPETLSRIFARMSQENLIRVDGRTIEIVDKEGLAALADGGRRLT